MPKHTPYHSRPEFGLAQEYLLSVEVPYHNDLVGTENYFMPEASNRVYRCSRDMQRRGSEAFGQKNADGARTGWWRIFQFGQLDQEELYVDGVLTQSRRYSHLRLYRVTHHRRSTASQKVTTVSDMGTRVKTVTYSQAPSELRLGIRSGKYTEYDTLGNVFLVAPFRKDKLHGVVKVYYPNGNLHMTCNYSSGMPQGFLNSYREDGALRYRLEFRRGKLKGWCYLHDRDSNLLTSGFYSKGCWSQRTGSLADKVSLSTIICRKSLLSQFQDYIALPNSAHMYNSFYKQAKHSNNLPVPSGATT